MIPLVVRRCVHAVTVLLLAVVGAFLLLHLLPGLPAAWIAGSDAPPATIGLAITVEAVTLMIALRLGVITARGRGLAPAMVVLTDAPRDTLDPRRLHV